LLITTILRISIRVIQLLANLFSIWITFDWKVRKTRKAFERELIQQGIPKREARRLSRSIKEAKDQIMSSLWKLAFSM